MKAGCCRCCEETCLVLRLVAHEQFCLNNFKSSLTILTHSFVKGVHVVSLSSVVIDKLNIQARVNDRPVHTSKFCYLTKNCLVCPRLVSDKLAEFCRTYRKMKLAKCKHVKKTFSCETGFNKFCQAKRNTSQDDDLRKISSLACTLNRKI